MKILNVILLTSALLLSGCSSVNTSSIADSATTYIALGVEGAKELNPILSNLDKAPTAIGAFILTKGVEYSYRTHLPRDTCIKYMHILSSFKWGASGNNLSIVLGADGKLPLIIGLISGLAAYNQPVNQFACDKKGFF